MKDRILKRFNEEIATLERELKVELPKEIQRARELGDLRENAEYKAAKERQEIVNARIAMNSRWPDILARRLAAAKKSLGISNEGIAGNRLLGDGAGVSALARFDRDVLMQTGAAYVIVLEGINDIGVARNAPTPTAQDLIAAHRQMIDRAHAQGLKMIGATLTPFEGAAYFTPEGEAKREALNEFIRTGGWYDAVIDFDKVTRDPAAPTKFNPQYDSGDHLHPNDAGYKAMGEAIDLAVFK